MKEQIIFQFLIIYSVQWIISAKSFGGNESIIDQNEEANVFTPENTTSGPINCSVMLNFSNMELHHIGSNFIASPYVKNLTLQNNGITTVEKDAFNSLPNLEYLDMSHNKLSVSELFLFGEHQNLKVLILDYNCGDSYCSPTVESKSEDYPDFDVNKDSMSESTTVRNPTTNYDYYYYRRTTTERTTTNNYNYYYGDRTIGRLYIHNYFPELIYLSLRKIKMDSFLGMFNLPKLNYLDVSENDFNKPNNNIFDSIPVTLKNLVMEGVGLTAMSTQKFKSLILLKLNYNRFETISNHYCYDNTLCLQDLHNLLYLSISKCMITKIEIDAFKDTENLLELDISDNKIINIPNGTFHYIPSLKKLDLSRNNFSVIPDLSILKNLSTLMLNNVRNKAIFNSLEIFSYMPNLKVISLRHNDLTTLPLEFFDNLPSLEEIDLGYNHIASLSPWQSQSTLRNLYLNYNKISNIDDLSLTDAKSLQVLDLRNNSVRQIKVESLKKISDNAILHL